MRCAIVACVSNNKTKGIPNLALIINFFTQLQTTEGVKDSWGRFLVSNKRF